MSHCSYSSMCFHCARCTRSNRSTPPAPGDDLITPVFIPPTRSPTAGRPGAGSKPGHVAGGASGKPVCDDEDCFVGSGSGEITAPEDHVSTTGAKGTGLIQETKHSDSVFVPENVAHECECIRAGSSTPSSSITTDADIGTTFYGPGTGSPEAPYGGTYTPGSTSHVSTTTVGGIGSTTQAGSSPGLGPSVPDVVSVETLPPSTTFAGPG